MTDLEQLAESAATMARRVFALTGSIRPHAVIDAPRALIVAGLVMRGDGDKDLMAAALRARLRDEGAERYVLVAEAWVSRLAPGEDPTTATRPSERADREEVVMIQAEDATTEVWLEMPVLRPPGAAPQLGPARRRPGLSGGRFCGLLRTVGASH